MLTLNGHPVQPTQFPDHTSQVWKLPDDVLRSDEAKIEWKFSHEGEFMYLAQLVELIRRYSDAKITLHMDYLPYARQDKPVSNESTFALKTFANLLNSLDLDRVTTVDVHSDAADYLIKNFYNEKPWYFVKQVSDTVNPDVLVFPDKGAKDRYGKDLAFLQKIHLFGEKTRDQQTGHITDYSINGDVTDRSVLIVDDICDGGMTFILLAKKLLTMGARCVNLYTTHGIYSKGLKPLRKSGISRIFCKEGEVGEIQGQVCFKKL